MHLRALNSVKSSDGFSLLELALVMIISGILFTVALTGYSLTLQSNDLDTLFEDVRYLESTLAEYKGELGRLPCPADPTLAPNDANYGRENCAIGAVVVPRDVDGVGGNDTILIGSFPYQDIVDDLGDNSAAYELASNSIIDPYGNKYLYAVTQTLTNVGTFNDFWGAIRVIDEFDRSVVDPADRVHYVLLSHGKNAKGAFSAQGVLVEPFIILPPGPPPPPNTPVVAEIENANGDGTFLSGLYNKSDVLTNDDYVSFSMTQTGGLWRIVGADTSVVPPVLLVSNRNPGNVGVGVQDPTERLEINGDLRTIELRAQQLCDDAGADCMPVSRLAGDDPEMECDNPGELVIAFANNQKICGPAFPGPAAVTCDPVLEYMNGFSNLGNVLCFPR